MADIISKSLRNHTIHLTEEDIFQLYRTYSAKLDLISPIIEAFVEQVDLNNQQLIEVLSGAQARSEWQAGLLKHGKLSNI